MYNAFFIFSMLAAAVAGTGTGSAEYYSDYDTYYDYSDYYVWDETLLNFDYPAGWDVTEYDGGNGEELHVCPEEFSSDMPERAQCIKVKYEENTDEGNTMLLRKIAETSHLDLVNFHHQADTPYWGITELTWEANI